MAVDHSKLRRIGAVALFCGLPLLVVALTVGNLAEASAGRALAARENATAAQIVDAVARRQSLRLRPEDTSSLYLVAASSSLARAQLQESAGRFVKAAGGHLEEAQFTSTPEQEAEGMVAIQISLTVGNNGLRDLLYAIETATPLFDVTDLDAKPYNGRGAAEVERDDLLHVDLTVEGHFRKGTG